jgi:hypothetical protein
MGNTIGAAATKWEPYSSGCNKRVITLTKERASRESVGLGERER